MLFRAAPHMWNLDGLTLLEANNLANILAHGEIPVRPIFECVKVYAKLDENSEFRYARHLKDFSGIEKSELAARMKSPIVREAVSEALDYVEETLIEYWPFRPGSSTWCLLEILDSRINIAGMENPTKIIVRKATRIDIKGNKTSSPLVGRMFERMCHDINNACENVYVVDPVVYLRNISGSGAYSDLKTILEGATLEGGWDQEISALSGPTQDCIIESIKEFADELFISNSETMLSETMVYEDRQFYLDTFPGINVKIEERVFRLSGSFIKSKESLLEEKKNSYPPLFAWRA